MFSSESLPLAITASLTDSLLPPHLPERIYIPALCPQSCPLNFAHFSCSFLPLLLHVSPFVAPFAYETLPLPGSQVVKWLFKTHDFGFTFHLHSHLNHLLSQSTCSLLLKSIKMAHLPGQLICLFSNSICPINSQSLQAGVMSNHPVR